VAYAGVFGPFLLLLCPFGSFLSKDLYHLYQACKNLAESDYSEQSLKVLEFIDNRRLETELEELPEDTLYWELESLP